MAAWSPNQYLQFEDERSRPARDLLAQVRLTRATRVVDIGCGPGNSTELLVEHFPDAEIIGLDSSAEMLAAARKRLPDVTFVEADVAAWTPSEPVDLLFANAVFQWVPDHVVVLHRLLEELPSGGVLAMQVPDNLDEPSHRLMREVAASGPWTAKFAEPIRREVVSSAAGYHDLLDKLSSRIDIWQTVYNHALERPAAIVEWVKGTGLRPFLDRLDEAEQAAFLSIYTGRLGEEYLPRVDGQVLLRFPRLFLVAVRA